MLDGLATDGRIEGSSFLVRDWFEPRVRTFRQRSRGSLGGALRGLVGFSAGRFTGRACGGGLSATDFFKVGRIGWAASGGEPERLAVSGGIQLRQATAATTIDRAAGSGAGGNHEAAGGL